MNRPDEKSPRNAEAEAPQGLRDALARLFASEAAVPPEADAAILAEARRHFARMHRPRRVVRWIAAGAAAAAAAVFAVHLATFTRERSRKPAAPAAPRAKASRTVAREDIDGDGRVDILDAFALARRLEAGGRPRSEWDVNHDGQVDDADVQRVARAAVELDRGVFQ